MDLLFSTLENGFKNTQIPWMRVDRFKNMCGQGLNYFLLLLRYINLSGERYCENEAAQGTQQINSACT